MAVTTELKEKQSVLNFFFFFFLGNSNTTMTVVDVLRLTYNTTTNCIPPYLMSNMEH